MTPETLDKFSASQRLARSLSYRLADLSERLFDIGMDKLAKEVHLSANAADHIATEIDEATGEAVGSYYHQSVEGTNNMMRACIAMAGADPDEIFPRKDA